MTNFSFTEKSEELDNLLNRYRSKWQLNALAWMDYDDVCQIIRLHIFQKWHLWDQERPFKPWASMVISHQMMNLVRNNYSNFAKPCLKCPHYMGGDGCNWTASKLQDSECPLMAKWKKKKEKAYNLRLPLPLEDGVFIGQTHQEDHFDYDVAENRLHRFIMGKLNEKHRMIYKMLYVDGETEDAVAEKFKFKADPSKRKTARYKQISNLKKKFYELALEIIKTEDVL